MQVPILAVSSCDWTSWCAQKVLLSLATALMNSTWGTREKKEDRVCLQFCLESEKEENSEYSANEPCFPVQKIQSKTDIISTEQIHYSLSTHIQNYMFFNIFYILWLFNSFTN